MAKELKDFSTDELIEELRGRDNVWAVKVWLRADIDAWLDENLKYYDNDTHDLSEKRDEIVSYALMGTASLDDVTEGDMASIDYYLSDVLYGYFDAHTI